MTYAPPTITPTIKHAYDDACGLIKGGMSISAACREANIPRATYYYLRHAGVTPMPVPEPKTESKEIEQQAQEKIDFGSAPRPMVSKETQAQIDKVLIALRTGATLKYALGYSRMSVRQFKSLCQEHASFAADVIEAESTWVVGMFGKLTEAAREAAKRGRANDIASVIRARDLLAEQHRSALDSSKESSPRAIDVLSDEEILKEIAVLKRVVNDG